MNKSKELFLSIILLLLTATYTIATPKTYTPLVKKLKNEAKKHFEKHPPETEKTLHSSLDLLIWENSNEILKKYNIQPTDEKAIDDIRIQLAIELINTDKFSDEINQYLTSYGQRFRMELVDVLMEMRKYDLAIQTLKELKEDFPYDSQIKFLLGECHKFSGNPREAANYYSEASDNEETFSEALFNEGLMLMNLGVYEKANKALRSAIKSDSTNIKYRMNLAVSYSSQNRYKESMSQVEKCIILDKTNYDAYALMVQVAVIAKDYNNANKYVSTLIDLKKATSFQNLALGDYHFFIKEYNTADHYYTLALENNQLNCDYWKKKIKNAQCFSEILAYKTTLKDALRHCNEEAHFHYLLATLEYKDVKYKNALKSIDKALQQDSETAEYYELKGDIFAKVGLFHHAADAYQKAKKLETENKVISEKLEDALLCANGTRRKEIKEAFVF